MNLRNHALEFCIVIAALIATSARGGDDVMTRVSSGMAPFTDTFDDMLQRKTVVQTGNKNRSRPKERRARTADATTPQVVNREGSDRVALPRAPQTISTSFITTNLTDDITLLGGPYIPPDTMGAVGPNHFVVLINGSFAVYTKTGSLVGGSHISLEAFFALTVGMVDYPRTNAFDPRILFDRRSDRWFACALESGDPVQTNNHLILAVSQTNDPTGTWDKYLVEVGEPDSGGDTFFSDYDTLGVDDNGVYFGVRIFPDNLALDTFAKIVATPKAPLISVTPSLGSVFQTSNITDMFSSPQPAHNHDAVAADGRMWFVSTSTDFFRNINYRTITWSGGVPTLSSTSEVTTPTYSLPINAEAMGSTTDIDVGDDRLMMAMIRNNRLWTCRNIGVNSTGGSATADRTACEWLEIDVSTGTASLAQSGRVFDNAGSSPRFYYYPSIMVNGQGHAAMGFSGSKASEFIGAYTCGRLSTDTAGTMGSIDLIKAGEAEYTRVSGAGDNRWGDYSYTSLDPNDDMSLWTIQEYASNTGANRWGTWTAKLLAPAPTLNNPNGYAVQGATNVSLALTGTGFYDPGAGYTDRLDVTLSGDGISNYSVTFNNASNVTVNFDVSGAATTGLRDITLTNPDGQSATVVGGFLISGPLSTFVVEAAGGGNITTQLAGTPFSIAITAQDNAGNTIRDFTGTVDITSAGTLSAGGGTTPAFSAGVLSPRSVTFSNTGNFDLTATLSGGGPSGTSNSFDVIVNTFVKLQVLLPGETAAPGTASGKTGTPSVAIVDQPNLIRVNAVDANWNVITQITDTVAITTTDAAAVLPPSASLSGGTVTFSLTFKTTGTATVTATDMTDGSKLSDTSSSLNISLPAPVITSDSTAIGAFGVLFEYTITATNDPLSYSATNLPSWLSLNATTGVLSGIPDAADTFNPVISANNLAGSGSIPLQIAIGKVTPVVSWENPSDIAQGTALSATQLNATANAPGTFTYSPVAGTVLSFGSGQPLSVQFTPNDLNNYQLPAVKTVVINVIPPPVISSGPEINLSEVRVGQSVQFSFAGTVNAPATITWNFGDGIVDTTNSTTVSHVFTPAGNYTVTLTATDNVGQTITKTLAITVLPLGGPGTLAAIDSDGDGFSDELEMVLGSSHLNVSDTPFSGAPAGTPLPLTILKMGIKLNFAKPGSDAVSLSGTLDIPAGFTVANQVLTVDAGGVIRVFTLDAKGGGSLNNKSDKAKVSVKAAKGVVAAQVSKYQIKIGRGTFAANLADENLTGNVDVKNEARTVRVNILFDGKFLQKDQPQLYTAKTGKTGRTK